MTNENEEKDPALKPVDKSGLTSVSHDDLNPGFRLETDA